MDFQPFWRIVTFSFFLTQTGQYSIDPERYVRKWQQFWNGCTVGLQAIKPTVGDY